MPEQPGIDVIDNSWYIECISKDAYYIQCQDNMVFDEHNGICQKCPLNQHVPNLPSCDGYSLCHQNDIFIQKIDKPCETNEIYSNKAGKCISKDGSFICTKRGKFPDPFDCQRYQYCPQANALSLSMCCSNPNQVFVQGKGCVLNDNSVNCNIDDECLVTHINDISFCYDYNNNDNDNNNNNNNGNGKCPSTCPNGTIQDPANKSQ